jgi:type II secretory pathway component HofQ
VRVAELLARTILISDLPPSTSSRSSPAATKKESLGDNVRKTERTRQLSDLGSDIRPSNENEEDETERGSGLRDSNSGSESDSVDGNESGDAEETLESVASKEDEEQDAELKRLLGFYGSVVFQAFNRYVL